MTRKLGQQLLERGLITVRQLRKALLAQQMTGGHLGSRLVEFGLIDEATLGKVLAESLGVRYAGPGYLNDVPPELLGLMSPEWVRHYRAVPIGREDRALHLAVVDPRSLGQLSFRTGHRIVPYVAPEFRVLEAMERYYAIPRPLRTVVPSVVAPPSIRATPQPEVRARLDPTKIGKVVASADDERRGWSGFAPQTGARSAGGASSRPAATERALAPLSRILANVRNADEIARSAIEFVSRRAPRSIFFAIEDDRAQVNASHGFANLAREMKERWLPAGDGTPFELVRGCDSFRGPVPDEARDPELFERLGPEPPGEIALVPLRMNDRLEGVLYIDSARGAIRLTDDELALMRRKLELAMGMLAHRLLVFPPGA